jgi:hypothetical protein
MSSPPRNSRFTGKHPVPPGELPFTEEEEDIINDLAKHQDILKEIEETLEAQPGSSTSSIADIIRGITDHPSTNPADISELLGLTSILTSIQSDVQGPDAIDPTTEQKRRESVLEFLETVYQKKVDPVPSESSLPKPKEPTTAGQAIPNLQARRRGSNQRPTPTCFAGRTPEIQRPSFSSTIQGVPQSSLAETLRTLQGIPWVSPDPTDTPTGSKSPDPRPPKEGS